MIVEAFFNVGGLSREGLWNTVHLRPDDSGTEPLYVSEDSKCISSEPELFSWLNDTEDIKFASA